MKIDSEFTVGVPIERAWVVLTDLAGIAPCLPGAQLTGVEDGVYTGKVKVKVGPVISEYAGTARFSERDDAGYRAVIAAKGKDSRGAGNAAAEITASLRAEGGRTVVSVSTELSITGKIAQFGSSVIKEVSEKLLAQFAENLEAQLLVPAAAATPIEAAPTEAAPTEAAPVGAAPIEAMQIDTVPVEAAPIDLIQVAGRSTLTRLAPIGVGLIAVLVLIRLVSRARAGARGR